MMLVIQTYFFSIFKSEHSHVHFNPMITRVSVYVHVLPARVPTVRCQGRGQGAHRGIRAREPHVTCSQQEEGQVQEGQPFQTNQVAP